MGTGLKITIGVLSVIFLSMLGFRAWSSFRAIHEVPLIAIVCSNDTGVPAKLSELLGRDGYTPNSDFRFTLYPCDDPNTPRQAATMVTGENAKYLVVLKPIGLEDAKGTGITTLDGSQMTAKQIAEMIEVWLNNGRH